MATPSWAQVANAKALGQSGAWPVPGWEFPQVRAAYNEGKAAAQGQAPVLNPASLPFAPTTTGTREVTTPGTPGTPPYLDPRDALSRAQELGNLDLSSIQSEGDLNAVLAGDPSIRASIEENWKRGVRGTTENLGGRGIRSEGINDSDLYDVNRDKQLSNLRQDAALESARARNTAVQDWVTRQRATVELGYAALHRPGSAGTPDATRTEGIPGFGLKPTEKHATPAGTVTTPALHPGPGQEIVLPGQKPVFGGKVVRVGIGGSPGYTISPGPPGTPPGTTTVTRRRR